MRCLLGYVETIQLILGVTDKSMIHSRTGMQDLERGLMHVQKESGKPANPSPGCLKFEL